MDKKLVEMLHLELEPVGIFFGNTTTKSDLEASPNKKIASFLLYWLQQKGKLHP